MLLIRLETKQVCTATAGMDVQLIGREPACNSAESLANRNHLQRPGDEHRTMFDLQIHLNEADAPRRYFTSIQELVWDVQAILELVGEKRFGFFILQYSDRKDIVHENCVVARKNVAVRKVPDFMKANSQTQK